MSQNSFIKSKLSLVIGLCGFIGIQNAYSQDFPRDDYYVTGPIQSCSGKLDPNSTIQWSGLGASNDPSNNMTRYQPNSSINKQNVNQLALAWTYGTIGKSGLKNSIAVTEDAVIVSDADGRISALDKSNGCIRWEVQHKIPGVGSSTKSGFTLGPKNPDGTGRAIFYSSSDKAALIKLDYETGEKIWDVRYAQHPKITTRNPAVYHNGVIYRGHSNAEVIKPPEVCCDSRGVVEAIDAFSGELIWSAYTIDSIPTRKNPNDFTMGPSGANPWGTPTIDVKRNSLYVGTGQNYTGPHESGNSVIAFDLDTGKKKWEFLGVPNDVGVAACIGAFTSPRNFVDDIVGGVFNDQFPAACDRIYGSAENSVDFDLQAAPVLVEGTRGRPDVLLAASKSGEAWGINPDNGAKIWEGRFGAGGVYGGVHFNYAVDKSRSTMFIPVSDKAGPKSFGAFVADNRLGGGFINAVENATPGLYAVDVFTGALKWSYTTPILATQDNTLSKPNFGADRKNTTYAPAISASPSVVDGIVFAGTLSGYILALDADTGELLWQQDTVFDQMGTNGVLANGGAIDTNWPIVAGNMLFTASGYKGGVGGGGNALQAYRISGAAGNPAPVAPAPRPSRPAVPTIVQPEPVTPVPVRPAPVRPAPVTPAPTRPAPVAPALSAPSVPAAPSAGNLIKSVSASTQERRFPVNFAVDSDPRSAWTSWFIDNQWFVADLGSKQVFSTVTIDWDGGNGRRGYAAEYDVQVSDNQTNWKTVKTINNGNGGLEVVRLDRQNARYIRLNLRKRGALRGFSIKNIEIK